LSSSLSAQNNAAEVKLYLMDRLGNLLLPESYKNSVKMDVTSPTGKVTLQ